MSETDEKKAEILKLPAAAEEEEAGEPRIYQLHLRDLEEPVLFYDHRTKSELLVQLYECQGPRRPKGLGWFETLTGAWEPKAIRGLNEYFAPEDDQDDDDMDDDDMEREQYEREQEELLAAGNVDVSQLPEETLRALQQLSLGAAKHSPFRKPQ